MRGAEENGGEGRIRGALPEGTPAQEARYEAEAARWQDAKNRVRDIDPYWKPPTSMYEGIEGAIADLRMKTGAAEAHILDMMAKGIGPGEFVGESIPARGPGPINTKEQEQNNENGDEYGCHTCGRKDPGTKSGDWVGDYQPPSALNIFGRAQRIYPHAGSAACVKVDLSAKSSKACDQNDGNQNCTTEFADFNQRRAGRRRSRLKCLCAWNGNYFQRFMCPCRLLGRNERGNGHCAGACR